MGCGACNDAGRFELAECPTAYVDSEIWNAMEYAKLYEKGLPPVAGGSLDQSHWFTAACRAIWNEQAYWKNKLGAIGGE